MAAPRSAKQVIDQAISENKKWELLLYGFSVIFVTVGLSLIVRGTSHGDKLSLVMGLVNGTVLWPVLKFGFQIRRENMWIRLSEKPLSLAGNTQEATTALIALAQNIASGKTPSGGIVKIPHTYAATEIDDNGSTVQKAVQG